MIEEYKSGKERLHEEFSQKSAAIYEEFLQKIAVLHDLLDEKGLIIEILKKDLEIKAEENKEISIEMELEIERLAKNCIDLEEQVARLTPLAGDALSPRDPCAVPARSNSPNPPTPRVRSSPSPPSLSPSLSPSEPSLSLKAPSSSLSPGQEVSTLKSEVKLSKPVPPLALSTSASPSCGQPAPPHVSTSTSIPSPHPPPPRFKSFPSLSALPWDLGPREPTSPRNSSPRPSTPRGTPRLPFSSTLFDSPVARPDSRSKTPNFDVSLAKLAELGSHPPAPSQEHTFQNPLLAEAEITELKKRIVELEADRLQMIEEYRTKKAVPPETTPTTTTSTTTSTPLGTSVSLLRASTPPPLPPIPTLPISSINKSSPLPPVPLPPSSAVPPPSTATTTSPSLSSASPASFSPISSSPLPSSFQPRIKSQDSPPPSASSSVHARPTRSRNKERGKGTSPNSGPNSGPNSDSEQPKKDTQRYLTWLQASVCVAVGSAAFYLVQTVLRRYY